MTTSKIRSSPCSWRRCGFRGPTSPCSRSRHRRARQTTGRAGRTGSRRTGSGGLVSRSDVPRRRGSGVGLGGERGWPCRRRRRPAASVTARRRHQRRCRDRPEALASMARDFGRVAAVGLVARRRRWARARIYGHGGISHFLKRQRTALANPRSRKKTSAITTIRVQEDDDGVVDVLVRRPSNLAQLGPHLRRNSAGPVRWAAGGEAVRAGGCLCAVGRPSGPTVALRCIMRLVSRFTATSGGHLTVKQGRRDSNPQPSVLETDALPD